MAAIILTYSIICLRLSKLRLCCDGFSAGAFLGHERDGILLAHCDTVHLTVHLYERGLPRFTADLMAIDPPALAIEWVRIPPVRLLDLLARRPVLADETTVVTAERPHAEQHESSKDDEGSGRGCAPDGVAEAVDKAARPHHPEHLAEDVC